MAEAEFRANPRHKDQEEDSDYRPRRNYQAFPHRFSVFLSNVLCIFCYLDEKSNKLSQSISTKSTQIQHFHFIPIIPTRIYKLFVNKPLLLTLSLIC